jgi:hypothetical protein
MVDAWLIVGIARWSLTTCPHFAQEQLVGKQCAALN